MMHDAENHPEWNTILIYDFSRFARNHADAIKYKQMLRYNGISVVSVTQDFGTSNESAIVEGFIDLINAQYSINNARATHSGMKQNAQTCSHNGGKPPLGYDVDLEGKLVINEVEADTVRRIFDLVEKDYSYAQIAETLNTEGRKTKLGKSFIKTSFSSILSQEKYTGLYIWNKAKQKDFRHKRNSHLDKPIAEQIRVEGGCPQIISREQFDRVQAKLSSRSRGKATSKSSKHYMLSGIGVLKCANCGAEMRGNSRGQGKTIYICPNHKDKDCPTKELLTTNVDEMVANLLANDLYNRKDYKKISKAMNDNRAEYKMAEKKLKDLLRAKENIIKAIEKSYADELIDRLEKIKKDETTARRELAALQIKTEGINEDNRRSMCKRYKKLLMESDSLEVKTHLQKTIKEILVGNDDVKITLNIA
jgi:site-specific DNA recombinase